MLGADVMDAVVLGAAAVENAVVLGAAAVEDGVVLEATQRDTPNVALHVKPGQQPVNVVALA